MNVLHEIVVKKQSLFYTKHWSTEERRLITTPTKPTTNTNIPAVQQTSTFVFYVTEYFHEQQTNFNGIDGRIPISIYIFFFKNLIHVLLKQKKKATLSTSYLFFSEF